MKYPKSHPGIFKFPLFIFILTIAGIVSVAWIQSCTPGTDTADTAIPPGISPDEYNELSRNWQKLIVANPDTLYSVHMIDSTVGGRFSYEEIQALAATRPADGFIYLRFARDPATSKISVMLRGQRATGEPLIYRNSGENFCPVMCD